METPFSVDVEFQNLALDTRLRITSHLLTEQGIVAFRTGSAEDGQCANYQMPPGLLRRLPQVPGSFLNSGMVQVASPIVENRSSSIPRHSDVASFEMIDLGENRGACTANPRDWRDRSYNEVELVLVRRRGHQLLKGGGSDSASP
jgi:hypothetical protein